MSKRVAILTFAQLATTAAVLLLVAGRGGVGMPRVIVVGLLAIAFAFVGSLPMHIELRRHSCAVTFVEAIIVVALVRFHLSEVVAAATLGELATCVIGRQRLKQLSFNVSAAAATTSVAVGVFAILRHGWAGALAAAAFYGIASHVSTSAVLSIVEERSFASVFSSALVPSAAATAVSATLGSLAVVLLGVSPAAVLLVVPLVVLMVVETRRVAVYRADHLRFKRLYAASSRSGGLTSIREAMSTLAEESRSLVTGAAAICCSIDRTGEWRGMVVADTGARLATDDEIGAALNLSTSVGTGAGAEVTGDDIPRALRDVVSPVESLVVAASDDDAAARVVVAVLRQLPGDDASRARADVLTAFIGHAALTIANAGLYADVEEALAHQLDLNRQKDDFVAVVSHELRTPLTSMIGAMSTLRRMAAQLTPDKHEALMSIALRQGDRLKQLIEDLLLISQVENASPDVARRNAIDLDDLVGDIAEEFSDARRGGAGVAVSRDLGQLAIIRSDESKVRQIITNLVDNARKYAPSSPVHVRAEVTEAEHAGGLGTVRVHVTDEGPGIAADEMERVFERFVQLDQTATRKQGGTGLGLYLCRLLANALGGTLTLSAAPAGGCCFTLTLPYDTVERGEEVEAELSAGAARPFSFQARPLVLSPPPAALAADESSSVVLSR